MWVARLTSVPRSTLRASALSRAARNSLDVIERDMVASIVRGRLPLRLQCWRAGSSLRLSLVGGESSGLIPATNQFSFIDQNHALHESPRRVEIPATVFPEP